MNWTVRDSETSNISHANATKAEKYEEEKAQSLPAMTREAQDSPAKPFEPVSFQPVRSPRHYEAEFASKGGDVIFHFWPDGYHEAERKERPTPRFQKDFQRHLEAAMKAQFRVDPLISQDEDVGALFVRIPGKGDGLFFRELSIKACTQLHELLGGDS